MSKRITAAILVLVLSFSLIPFSAFAESLDGYGGQVNVMIQSQTPDTFLDVDHGSYTSALSARIWNYITADGKVKGPAFCINHNSGYPTGYITVDLTPYTANPTMTAAFGSGYPLVSLADFTAAHPECAGLTEHEYGYASQIAIWATLGQIAVEGTAYTSGAETVVRPTDAEKMRVFNAVLAVLASAQAGGGSSGAMGVRIQAEENALGDTVDLGAEESLKDAAEAGHGGIRTETIGGKQYYTREFSVICSTLPTGGAVTLTLSGAPSGTILADRNNQQLPANVATLTASGAEYACRFKVCVPADAAAAATTGSITLSTVASVSSCTYYLVNNAHAYEQNFIIADPSGSTGSAAGYLKWGESTGTPTPETASIRVVKTGENGAALAGAEFSLDGSGGYHASGTTGSDGSITWTDLPADQTYTVTETNAPEGYQIVNPVNVTVVAGQTSYTTITDTEEHRVRIHKQDKQNGYSLEGATFRFSQIDGDYIAEAVTGADGLIEFVGDELPYGSYRVTEVTPPAGYEKDDKVETINWDGKNDVDLYFTNVRKTGFKILKVNENNEPLIGAVFNVYKDGDLITSVRTDNVGVATVSDITEGYYEVEEIVAPDGYILDSTRHGIHVDPYNPALTVDPMIQVINKARPALRIVKYDGQTQTPLSNTTFQVYKDSTLLGEYTTDARGEIYLYDLEPGTYRVQEIATPDSHVVDSTPQEIELRAGMTEMATLVFFNYTKPGIHLVKVDSRTMDPLPNTRFRITQVGGTYSEELRTDANGEIDVTHLTPGSYKVTELEAPEGYLIDDPERTIKIEAGENASFIFTDTKKPGLVLIKYNAELNKRLPGATFRIAKVEDGSRYLDRITDANGEIHLDDLEPGVYSVQELAAPAGYVLDETEFHVELFAGQTSQIVLSNCEKPDLRIVKLDAETGAYLPGAVFSLKKVDSSTLTSVITGADGDTLIEDLDPGVYEITEKTPPSGYLPARNATQLITLEANKLGTAFFSNYEKPTLTVTKVSSVSGEPLKGVKFQVTYRSNNTETGSMSNLGYFLTDDNGQFKLTDLTDGWYTITELETIAGYSIKDAVQEVYIRGGEDKELTFQNTPLSALVVYKYDTVSGEAVSGAKFTVRKLSDTSGTGGTVIGTYVTGPSGSFTVTGLAEGAYVVEEISADSGHVIDTAPQTAYISGKQMDVVELYFGNAPKGSVLVRKIDSVSHEPLAGVEFSVTDSTGAVVGNANGRFVTDASGSFLIENLDPSLTLVVKETRTLDGYVMDDVPQTVKVRAGHTVTLEFRNSPYGGLIIQKIDTVTKKPLEGAVFTITNSSGAFVDRFGNNVSSASGVSGTGENGFASSNGRYVTDAEGQIRLPLLKPDTYVVTEVQAPDGYVLSAQPQTVRINSADTQTLTFGNPPKGALLIVKRDSVTGAPMEGVRFSVKTSGGEPVGNGEFVTDGSGQITITDLEPGTYVVTETATISGYVLDATARNAVVRSGETRTLELTNRPKGNLLVRKIDSVTKEPLAGAEFKITLANGTQADDNEGLTSTSGLYVTDENGEIYLTKLNPGSYIITETRAPDNYKLASGSRTVVVRAADTQTVTFSDDPLCTLTLIKRDAVTQKGLPYAEFTVKYSDGRVVGTENGRFVTGADGTATVSGLTPDATVIVSETRAPAGYVKDDSPKSIVVRTGVANSLTFLDEPTTTLVIHKYIDGSQNEPLAGVGFRVMDSSGAMVGPDDGIFYTDETGEIVISDLEPGITVIVREFKTVDGFVLNGNPQDILIKEGQVQELVFWNQRKGSLTIVKQDSVTKQPLPGVQFKVTYADGRVVDTEGGKLSSNGLYETDAHGRITISGVTGTLVVTEIKTIAGYRINEGTRTQTVVVHPDDGQTLYFLNDPLQTLTLQKYEAGTTTPIAGVEFLVTDSGGAVVGPNNGRYVSDQNGRAVISGLTPGTTITVRETWTPSGYLLNTTPQSILIKEGDAQELTIYNEKKGTLIVRKLDSVSGDPLEGAEFLITTIDGAFVDDNEGQTSTKGIYRTDKNGEIRLLNLQPDTYVIRETAAPEGYVLEREEQTVKVNARDTQTVEFYNTPKQTVVLQKFIEGTTKPLAGVTFLVTDGSGNPIGSANGEHTTDENGRIVLTGLTPGTTIVAKEVRTATGYVLNSMPQTLTVGSGNPSRTLAADSNTLTATAPAASANSANSVTVEGNTITFYDSPLTTLRIKKFVSGTANEPLAGVGFEVTDGSGAQVGPDGGIYYTNAQGEIVLYNLEPGTTVNVREVRTVDGFVLDGTPQQILIKSGGEEQSLTFWNQRMGSLLIRKLDSVTQQPLEGATFRVTYANGEPVDTENGHVSSRGIYTTNCNGEININGIVGTILITEEHAPEGYSILTNCKTKAVTVNPEDGQTVLFYNDPHQSVVVEKYVQGTSTPIAGAKFLVTDSAGTKLGQENGYFTTDTDGRFTVGNLEVGTTITVKEVSVPDPYVLDSTPQSIQIRQGDAQRMVFYNTPKQLVTVQKYVDGTLIPIQGVKFLITDSNGNPLGTSNGEQLTDSTGRIQLSVDPGTTVIAKELATVKGYSVNTEAQSLVVKANTVNELVFYDTPLAALIIHNYIAGTNNEPLVNSAFEVRDGTGAAVGPDGGTYYTDENGDIVLFDLEPGLNVTVRQVQVADGFILNGIPQSIEIKSGVNQLTFWNHRPGSLLIRKLDSVTQAPVAGAEFSVRYADGTPVDTENGKVSSAGTYKTNSNGEILITGVTGTIVVTEEKAPEGYILNEHDRTKAVVVNPEDGQTLEFYNDPVQALTLRKYIAGTDVPIQGVKFLVTDSSGAKLGPDNGIFITDANGRITIPRLVPGATVTAVETEAAKGYTLDATPQSILIKQGEAQSLSFYNVPKQVLVLQKYVAGTSTPISGVTFLLTDESGKPIGNGDGIFVTDGNGRIVISDLDEGDTVIAKEISTVTGYSLNSDPQTIKIQSGAANTLTFYDTPQTTLTIYKYITGTDNTPLPGVTFKITDSSGAALGANNGVFVTDKAGTITIPNLEPGTTVRVQVIQTVDGFVLDGNPQEILIKAGESQSLSFYNSRQGSVIIRKLDSVTKAPIAGVEFKICYSDGRFVDKIGGKVSTNGIFFTDRNGEIYISDITGTLIITEEKTVEGYTIEESTRTQMVTVNPDSSQILYCYNTPIGGVELIKVNADNKGERIPGTTFEIRKMDDALVSTVTTDKNGRAFAALEDGAYYAVEITAAEGYKLDPTPIYFEVKAGTTTSQTVTNEKFSGITIHKIDSKTRQGIYGVTFILYDEGKTPVEQVMTDQYGYARTSRELKAGQYFLRELEPAEGYVADTQYKTVFLEAGRSTTVEWENTPITAQIQLTKYAAESNSVTGQAKGSTLQGAVYEIVRERSGAVVATITTNARGVAASPALPLGRYLVREVTAPAYWQLSEQTFDVTLEYAGQIIKIADYDKPAELGVTITKTGNASVMVGSPMTYKISVANTSNVPLDSFYWHDRIPTDISTATTLTTGTYSARLNYRILYRTNYNQTYQVLASNLITTNNYSFGLNAIPTQAGEKVTDVYFEFGKVPVGFQSVTGPTLTVVVNGDAANGYQMVNRADVGGKYGETWQTAQAGWVTTIVNLNKDPVLPKTGY